MKTRKLREYIKHNVGKVLPLALSTVLIAEPFLSGFNKHRAIYAQESAVAQASSLEASLSNSEEDYNIVAEPAQPIQKKNNKKKTRWYINLLGLGLGYASIHKIPENMRIVSTQSTNNGDEEYILPDHTSGTIISGQFGAGVAIDKLILEVEVDLYGSNWLERKSWSRNSITRDKNLGYYYEKASFDVSAGTSTVLGIEIKGGMRYHVAELINGSWKGRSNIDTQKRMQINSLAALVEVSKSWPMPSGFRMNAGIEASRTFSEPIVRQYDLKLNIIFPYERK